MISDELIEQVLNLAANPVDAEGTVNILREQQKEFNRLQTAYKDLVMGRAPAKVEEDNDDDDDFSDSEYGDMISAHDYFNDKE